MKKKLIFHPQLNRKRFDCVILADACHEDWYNKCTSNADCCSKSCYKGVDGDWLDGICEPDVMATSSTPMPTL